jgi:hypothetical protein
MRGCLPAGFSCGVIHDALTLSVLLSLSCANKPGDVTVKDSDAGLRGSMPFAPNQAVDSQDSATHRPAKLTLA